METINGASIYRGAADPVTVDGAETHGTYSMLLGTLPHDDSPPDHHLHPHTNELFYIADGEMTLHVGDRTFTASSGTAVFVPRGWRTPPGCRATDRCEDCWCCRRAMPSTSSSRSRSRRSDGRRWRWPSGVRCAMRCPYCGSSDQRVGHESPRVAALPTIRHVHCGACGRWWTQTSGWRSGPILPERKAS
jgi:hypothetical protein